MSLMFYSREIEIAQVHMGSFGYMVLFVSGDISRFDYMVLIPNYDILAIKGDQDNMIRPQDSKGCIRSVSYRSISRYLATS